MRMALNPPTQLSSPFDLFPRPPPSPCMRFRCNRERTHTNRSCTSSAEPGAGPPSCANWRHGICDREPLHAGHLELSGAAEVVCDERHGGHVDRPARNRTSLEAGTHGRPRRPTGARPALDAWEKAEGKLGRRGDPRLSHLPRSITRALRAHIWIINWTEISTSAASASDGKRTLRCCRATVLRAWMLPIRKVRRPASLGHGRGESHDKHARAAICIDNLSSYPSFPSCRKQRRGRTDPTAGGESHSTEHRQRAAPKRGPASQHRRTGRDE